MRALMRYVCADCGDVFEGQAPAEALCPACLGRLVVTGAARVRPLVDGPQPGLLLVQSMGGKPPRRLRRIVLKKEGSPWTQ